MNHLVNQNYGDVMFNVQGERMRGIRMLICSQNEALNQIISDPLATSVIDISPDVSPSSFSLLLTYYGYGAIKIDDDNVVDMIVICVSYGETSLLNVCIKYLHDHFNYKLAFDLFSNLKILNSRNLEETKKLIQSYIPIVGSYIIDSDIFYQLDPQIIEDILRTNNLITESEEFLVEKISSYFKENCLITNNTEVQDCLKKLLFQIKWSEIPREKINQNLLQYYNINNLTPRIYFSINIYIYKYIVYII